MTPAHKKETIVWAIVRPPSFLAAAQMFSESDDSWSLTGGRICVERLSRAILLLDPLVGGFFQILRKATSITCRVYCVSMVLLVLLVSFEVLHLP